MKDKLINGVSIHKFISKMDLKDFENLERFKGKLGNYTKSVKERTTLTFKRTQLRYLIEKVEYNSNLNPNEWVVPEVYISDWVELLNNVLISKIWKW